MTITELTTGPDLTALAPSARAGRIGTTFRHTWYLTGRKLHAVLRQPGLHRDRPGPAGDLAVPLRSAVPAGR